MSRVLSAPLHLAILLFSSSFFFFFKEVSHVAGRFSALKDGRGWFVLVVDAVQLGLPLERLDIAGSRLFHFLFLPRFGTF